MKIKKILPIFAVPLIGALIGVTTLNSRHASFDAVVVDAAESVETYYKDISDSLTGTALLNALNTLNSKKKTRSVGYKGFRTFAAKCDIDPSGSNKIVGFYNNTEVGPAWDSGKTWNREHVWPDSLGGNKVEDDAHMVRPTSTSINSERGNKYYGSSGNTYDPGQYIANYRGIAARIVFYCAIADKSLTIIDSNSGGSNQMGKLSDLLRWNLEYLPGTSTKELRVEQNRNNVIQTDSSGQGNRNPFIDHPEYACKIWGNTNSTTQSICKAYSTGITISKASASLEVESSTTISAKTTDSSSITWTNSNPDVVSLSASSSASNQEITLTGLSIGTSTLTAKATIDGEEYSKTCTVTVSAKSTLSSITLSGTYKTKFYVNSEFSYSGLVVTARYTSGASKSVTDFTVTPPDMTSTGKKSVSVSYTDDGITKSASYLVDIVNKPSGGCGGNIITSSVVLSSLSLVGIGLLLIKRKFIK